LPALTVSDGDRQVLVRWTRRRTVSAALAQRARIVLAAAEDRSNSEVAAAAGCHAATVGKWRVVTWKRDWTG
jgi:hypothetical protein